MFIASARQEADDHDYHLHVVELHNTGPTTAMALVALCPGSLGKPIQPQMVILGSPSHGGNIVRWRTWLNLLQLAFDPRAKRILLPIASA